MNEPTKLTRGLWRPDATIICIGCHVGQCGNDYGFSREPKPIDLDGHKLRERNSHEALAHCDECGRQIWMGEGVAYEQSIVAALKEKGYSANMQQTGGMCSAAELALRDDEDGCHWVWITWAENDGPPEFTVGLTSYDPRTKEESEPEYQDNLLFDAAIAAVERHYLGDFEYERRQKENG